jgi:hypothetical protein
LEELAETWYKFTMRFGRDELSEQTRQLLCFFSSGDLERPMPQDDADWQELLQALSNEGLLLVAHRYLKQRPDQTAPPHFRQAVRQISLRILSQMMLFRRQVKKLLTFLNESDLQFLVIKGPAVAHTIYPEPGLRLYGDLDLVVRETDWTTAHRLLYQAGFQQVRSAPNQPDVAEPPPKFAPPVVIYEQVYRHPRTHVTVEIHYDDILNAGIASKDVEGFWQRAIVTELEGVPVRVMSLEDQLVHLCMHIHYHGYNRLNALTDIAFLVRDQASQLDWDKVMRVTRTEEAEVGVYYTLFYLEQLLDVSAPDAFIEAVRPDAFRRRWHEYYLPAAKVLSLEPMWRPDFSFYFHPLFKRLLPDMLVMGRRREKLACMLGLLLPPRNWLSYYYNLGEEQHLALHYFLHPFKLLYHYLLEIFYVIRTGQIPEGPSTEYYFTSAPQEAVSDAS